MKENYSIIAPVFQTPVNGHYFNGYYDKSPLDRESKRLLAMRVGFIDRLPDSNDMAEIGYFKLGGHEFRSVNTTNAFNWQQGAMLQWLGPGFDKEIIFNRRCSGEFRAVIYNIESGVERLLSHPIYTVNAEGTHGLLIDFERHYWVRRGYSYDGVVKKEKNLALVPGDGIWLLDILGDICKKIVPIETLLDIKPLASMKGATHYVEHMMFSPDGETFAFYHRWRLEEGGIYARLYVADIHGAPPKLVHDTGRLSHYCWIDNRTILAIGSEKPSLAGNLRRSKTLSRFIKPLFPFYRAMVKGNVTDGQTRISTIVTGDAYFLVDINTSQTKAVFRNSIDRDGHPSAITEKPGWVVTDTYPDYQSKAKLLIGNLQTGEMRLLDVLSSIPQFDNTPTRCDLHPKVSLDGRHVAIDTMNDGVRGIYLYLLPDLAK